jgi:hypothetical protein
MVAYNLVSKCRVHPGINHGPRVNLEICDMCVAAWHRSSRGCFLIFVDS